MAFGAVGNIIQELQREFNIYYNDLLLVNIYLDSKNCSENLAYEV